MSTSEGFSCSIELGNDAMRRPEHVADLLRHVAVLLEDGYETGPLYDGNGNAVGPWTVTFPGDES